MQHCGKVESLLSCFDLGLVAYERALAWQEVLREKRWLGELGDMLLLLEHPPVFTLGRGGKMQHLLRRRQVPVYRVGRGGDVTFHGPGQLVGYPIIALTGHRRDIHAYLRALETVLVMTLQAYGLQAHRREGLTGVWVGEEKIASIGVGVRRWVTYHGFALNVDPDLSYFSDIVPCGLAGVRMTSMARLLGRPVPLLPVKERVAELFARQFGYKEILWQRNLSTLALQRPTPSLEG
ncbi:MAG: lipoyl(octanoyl) transferase LipB [Candidatus Binatia bacterium]|nr:lipoyl(octanoyl) transferase LipB [Candidatus Binatia bacterium]